MVSERARGTRTSRDTRRGVSDSACCCKHTYDAPSTVRTSYAPPRSCRPGRPPRAGGEIVARVLREHGVRFVFTLVGGHVSPVLVGAKQLGIRVIDVRHEATAVFAA